MMKSPPSARSDLNLENQTARRTLPYLATNHSPLNRLAIPMLLGRTGRLIGSLKGHLLTYQHLSLLSAVAFRGLRVLPAIPL